MILHRPPNSDIAVLLVGQLRNFEKHVSSIKRNIIDPLDADVFVSTWDRLNAATPPDTKMREACLEAYHPIGYAFDTWTPTVAQVFKINTKNYRFAAINPASVLAMYNRWERGWHLLSLYRHKHIIKIRPDLQFERALTMEDIAVPPPLVAIPRCDGFTGGTMHDLMAIGGRIVMEMYLKIGRYLTQYNQDGFDIHPEGILHHHLEACKLQAKRFRFPMRLRGHWIGR